MGLLDKLFGKNKAKEAKLDPKTEKEAIDYFENRLITSHSDLEANLYPVPKLNSNTSIQLVSQLKFPVIQKRLSPELDFCFVAGYDTGENHTILTELDLSRLNATEEQIWDYANKNLMKIIRNELEVIEEDCSSMGEGFTSFFRVELNPNYLISILLIDDLIKDIILKKLNMKGLVVAMPARNQLYFADVRNLKSITTMLKYSELMYEASAIDGLEFSENLYIRIDTEKWEIFEPLVEGNYTRYSKIFNLTAEDLIEALK